MMYGDDIILRNDSDNCSSDTTTTSMIVDKLEWRLCKKEEELYKKILSEYDKE